MQGHVVLLQSCLPLQCEHGPASSARCDAIGSSFQHHWSSMGEKPGQRGGLGAGGGPRGHQHELLFWMVTIQAKGCKDFKSVTWSDNLRESMQVCPRLAGLTLSQGGRRDDLGGVGDQGKA